MCFKISLFHFRYTIVNHQHEQYLLTVIFRECLIIEFWKSFSTVLESVDTFQLVILIKVDHFRGN